MGKKKRKKSASQMGRAARWKGHQFEREISAALRVVFPRARRQLENHPDDAQGVDIQNTEPFFFQCKKLKTYAPITCIEEIQNTKPELGDVPVLVTAADGKRAMAVLPFYDLLRLITVAHGSS